jgi:entericidin B
VILQTLYQFLCEPYPEILSMPSVYTFCLILLLGGLVSGCNTVKGAGQDLEAGGNAIENSAQDAKSY